MEEVWSTVHKIGSRRCNRRKATCPYVVQLLNVLVLFIARHMQCRSTRRHFLHTVEYFKAKDL